MLAAEPASSGRPPLRVPERRASRAPAPRPPTAVGFASGHPLQAVRWADFLTVVQFSVLPVAAMVIYLAWDAWYRRGRIRLGDLRATGLVSEELPAEGSAVTLGGRARFGPFGATRSSSTLHLYPDVLAITSATDAFRAMVVHRSDIGFVRIRPTMAGATLWLYSKQGQQLDVRFFVSRRADLQRSLAISGWGSLASGNRRPRARPTDMTT